MRIISTMMLSKQTQSNCSLRSTVSLQEWLVLWAGGQRTSRGRNLTNQAPGPAAGWKHLDIFLALIMGQHWSCDSLYLGLTDHLFSDLKNCYTGLMNTQSLQFSLTPRKPESGNRCLRYWDFLQHCITQCLPKPWQKLSQLRVLRREYFSGTGPSGVPGVLVASR